MAVASTIIAAGTTDTIDTDSSTPMMEANSSQSSTSDTADEAFPGVGTRHTQDDKFTDSCLRRGETNESSTSHTNDFGDVSYRNNNSHHYDRDGSVSLLINSSRSSQLNIDGGIATKDVRLKDLQLIESYLLGSKASSTPDTLHADNINVTQENQVLFSTTEILHEQFLQHDPAALLDDERLLNQIMSSENVTMDAEKRNHLMWDHYHHTTYDRGNGNGHSSKFGNIVHDKSENVTPRTRSTLLSTSSHHSSANFLDGNSNHQNSTSDNGNFSSMAWKPMFQYDHTEVPYSPENIFTEINKNIPAHFALFAENTVDTAAMSSSPFPLPDSPTRRSTKSVENTQYSSTAAQSSTSIADHTAGAETLLFAAQVLRQETHHSNHDSVSRVVRRRNRTPSPSTSVGFHSDDQFVATGQKMPSKKGKNTDNDAVAEKGSKTFVDDGDGCTNNSLPAGHAIVENSRIVRLISDANISDNDVLLGRGGRTNNHIGNATYRTYKEAIQDEYLRATKDEKTCISNRLVQQIHQEQGRFLKAYEPLKDVTGKRKKKRRSKRAKANDATGAVEFWYEVDLLTARRKASQALREINTPENRAAKRAKYNK